MEAVGGCLEERGEHLQPQKTRTRTDPFQGAKKVSLTGVWRGEANLATTYWGYGVLPLICISVVEFGISSIVSGSVGLLIVAAIYLLVLPYLFFVGVAIWRSAKRYGGRRIWAFLARAVVVLNGVAFILTLVGIVS